MQLSFDVEVREYQKHQSRVKAEKRKKEKKFDGRVPWTVVGGCGFGGEVCLGPLKDCNARFQQAQLGCRFLFQRRISVSAQGLQ